MKSDHLISAALQPGDGRRWNSMGRAGQRASGVIGKSLEGGGLVDKSGALTTTTAAAAGACQV